MNFKKLILIIIALSNSFYLNSCNSLESSINAATSVLEEIDPTQPQPISDLDQDGVVDSLDLCVWSVKATQVDNNGCDVNLGSHKDDIVNFIDEKLSYQNDWAVFINIIRAYYDIDINVSTQTISVKTYLKFKVYEEGFPVFDAYRDIDYAELDKQSISIGTATPDNITTVKIAEKKVYPGKVHTLYFESQIPSTNYIQFNGNTIDALFQMSDLTDRAFLERYVPSNMQYDQVRMQFNVNLHNSSQSHKIIANGDITQQSSDSWTVDFRDFYNASSVYFHIIPDNGVYQEMTDTYTSINGQTIALHAYSKTQNVNLFIQQAIQNLNEFENIYGEWPHPYVIMYGISSGGMEYSGATRTSLSALRHEMHHAYFARAAQPARGNDGWIDEALASWGDAGFPSLSGFSNSAMAGHSPYMRKTDTDGYSIGEEVMSYINQQLSSQGGLNTFLNQFFANRNNTIFSTQMFQDDLEQFSGQDFSNVFTPIYSIYNDDISRSDTAPHEKACPHQEYLEE